MTGDTCGGGVGSSFGISILKAGFREECGKNLYGLLQKISPKGHATEDEEKMVVLYLVLQHTSEEFCKALKESNENLQQYVFHISRICQKLESKIKSEIQKRGTEGKVDITLISHGGLCLPNIPSQLHFISPNIRNVTLYSPWGCSIHSSVVYGIVTGNISPRTVSYSTANIRPKRPDEWNNLPSDVSRVPTILLTPVAVEKKPYKQLHDYLTKCSIEPKCIVIPYLEEKDGTNVGYPEVPLWVMCCSLSLLCAIYGKECHIHVACCLALIDNVKNQKLVDPITKHIRQSNYCTVPVNRPSVMKNMYGIPDELKWFRDILASII